MPRVPPVLYLQHGFTLLELLIAFSLSVLIFVMIAGGMYLVVRDWEQAGNRLEDKLEISIALQQVESALHGAFPHLYRDPDENKDYIYFEGEEDALTWVSTVSPRRRPGLSAWQLKADKEEGLEAAIVPVYGGNPADALEEAETFKLFEGWQATFQYLYVDTRKLPDSDEYSEWLDDWSAEEVQTLPAAVRMVLEKRGAKNGENLEMIAVIPANQHLRLRPKINFDAVQE